MDESADITMIEITIKRVIDADGKLAMMIKLPTRFSSIDHTLGLRCARSSPEPAADISLR
jgi:hypothetical protein